MSKIVLFGTKKMAQLANFYFTHDSEHEVVALTVNEDHIEEKELYGLPIVPFEEITEKYPPDDYKMFIAIAYKNLNMIREAKYNEAKSKGYELVSYFCSKSIHWGDTQIGDNCFIFENQLIQPWVKFGNNVIIWSGNHFGHDVEIGDHTFLASHVVCSGYTKIGMNCFIGVNSTFRDEVKVGNECIIGAGATIIRDVPDKSVHIPKQTEKFRLNSEEFERMMNR